ncbi:MAG: hypothetical protein LBR56_03820 [Sporomusaceae bacterium]|jgi:hypothetical protein|nr:hypothetical protein [Sporomusaceae bacterium]
MLVDELIYSLRLDIGDTNKTEFSDYQIINTLNSVLKIVNNALTKRKSDLITKNAVLALENDETELPADFIAIVRVVNENMYELFPQKPLNDFGYKIVGNSLTAQTPVVTITYRYSFPKINLGGEIPLPDWFSELLKKYVIMLISQKVNQFDVSFSQMIENDINNITSGREYSVIERELPFFI